MPSPPTLVPDEFTEEELQRTKLNLKAYVALKLLESDCLETEQSEVEYLEAMQLIISNFVSILGMHPKTLLSCVEKIHKTSRRSFKDPQTFAVLREKLVSLAQQHSDYTNPSAPTSVQVSVSESVKATVNIASTIEGLDLSGLTEEEAIELQTAAQFFLHFSPLSTPEEEERHFFCIIRHLKRFTGPSQGVLLAISNKPHEHLAIDHKEEMLKVYNALPPNLSPVFSDGVKKDEFSAAIDQFHREEGKPPSRLAHLAKRILSTVNLQ